MDRDKLASYTGREQASVKHFLLESYLARLVMITAQGRYNRIAYVDAFAGPWKSAQTDLSDTSFAKAIEVMESCRVQLINKFHRSVSFRALFVERDPTRFAQLKQFAERKSTTNLQITATNDDFAESAESVAHWIREDEMAFVLIDPTGWKDVISPKTLAPLLRRRNVEMLVNVMWNFINLATGHTNQDKNLRDIFGSKLESLRNGGTGNDGHDWMVSYLEQLRIAADDSDSAARLRTAWFPVEFPSKDRIFYYLAYVTHHVKGIIVFLEESERTLYYQKEMKFVVKQQRREADTGISDIFGDALQVTGPSSTRPHPEVRHHWLKLLPTPGSQLYVDESIIAEMAEKCGCLIPHLQSELRRLIDEGVLKNMDARRPRTKNIVNYKAVELISRLK